MYFLLFPHHVDVTLISHNSKRTAEENNTDILFTKQCNIGGPVIVRNSNVLRHGRRTSGVSWGVRYQGVASRSFESCWMSGWVSVDQSKGCSILFGSGEFKGQVDTFFLRSFGSMSVSSFLLWSIVTVMGVLGLHQCFHRWWEHCIVMRWLLLNLLVLLTSWLMSADVFVGCQAGAGLLADLCLAIKRTLLTCKVTYLAGKEMELVQKVLLCWSCSPVGFILPCPLVHTGLVSAECRGFGPSKSVVMVHCQTTDCHFMVVRISGLLLWVRTTGRLVSIALHCLHLPWWRVRKELYSHQWSWVLPCDQMSCWLKYMVFPVDAYQGLKLTAAKCQIGADFPFSE